nr:LysR substrate-binding domain-containing protein [uncultured Sphingomonas sp.]
MGAKLVHRTTRRLQPTSAGTAFYERMRIALRKIDEVRSDVMRGASGITGLFRVGASVQFAPRYVVPTATAFIERYPGVEVDLILSDTLMDLIEHTLDVVVRIGEPASSSLKSRLLGKLRRVVVAAPQYLARHGRPSTPPTCESIAARCGRSGRREVVGL